MMWEEVLVMLEFDRQKKNGFLLFHISLLLWLVIVVRTMLCWLGGGVSFSVHHLGGVSNDRLK